MLKKIAINIKHVLYTAFWCVFAYILPFAQDDWKWGGEVGLKRLSTFFAGYNGRILGNITEILMTRNMLMRIFFTCGSMIFIPFMIAIITEQSYAYEICTVFIFIMPLGMWRTTIGWTAGFSNYVVPVVFMLLMIKYFWRYWKGNDICEKQDVRIGILLFMLGVCNTLFMEHLTIYNVVCSFAFVVYIFYRYKKIYIQHILLFIGSCTGAFLMFSNSVYHEVAAGEDVYRSIMAEGLINQIKYNYLNVCYEYFFAQNNWINLTMLLALWAIVVINWNNYLKKFWIRWCLYIYSAYMGWVMLANVNENNMRMDACLALVGCFSLFVVLLSIFWNTVYWMRILFLILSLICICTPLFFVSPVSARCFFPCYILWILLLMTVLKYLTEKCFIDNNKVMVFKRLLGAMIIGISLFYLSVYVEIHQADVNRRNSIQSQIEAGEVEVEIDYLPYASFTEGATPTEEGWKKSYLSFWGFPKEIKIK